MQSNPSVSPKFRPSLTFRKRHPGLPHQKSLPTGVWNQANANGMSPYGFSASEICWYAVPPAASLGPSYCVT